MIVPLMFSVLLLQEALAQICEYSEAGITVRGTYFPPGKQPKEEERKLYLAIEATSELAIQKAKKEVTRLIKEELIRLVRIHVCFKLLGFTIPPFYAFFRFLLSLVLHFTHFKFTFSQVLHFHKMYNFLSFTLSLVLHI